MVIFEKCESRAIKRDRDQCCKHLTALNSAFLPVRTNEALQSQTVTEFKKRDVCCN